MSRGGTVVALGSELADRRGAVMACDRSPLLGISAETALWGVCLACRSSSAVQTLLFLSEGSPLLLYSMLHSSQPSGECCAFNRYLLELALVLHSRLTYMLTCLVPMEHAALGLVDLCNLDKEYFFEVIAVESQGSRTSLCLCARRTAA